MSVRLYSARTKIATFISIFIYLITRLDKLVVKWLDSRALALKQYGCKHDYVFHTVFFDETALQWIDYWNCTKCNLTYATDINKEDARSLSGDKIFVDKAEQ